MEVALMNPDDDTLDRMSVEELTDLLGSVVASTLQNLALIARIVNRIEAKGIKLTERQVPLLRFIRPVGDGRLCPEVVTQFVGRPSLIPVVMRLPMGEQKKIAAGEPVPLVVYGPNGEATHRMADPLAMTNDQIKQVFADDHIRNEAEQVLLLDQERTRERTKAPEIIGALKVDREAGGVWHKRELIPEAHLAAALTALRR